MVGRHNELVVVAFSIEGAYCGEPHIGDRHSSKVQLAESAQILGGIDELLLTLGFEEGEVLLLRLVHVGLLVEYDVAQLFLVDEAFVYGLADDVVNYLI